MAHGFDRGYSRHTLRDQVRCARNSPSGATGRHRRAHTVSAMALTSGKPLLSPAVGVATVSDDKRSEHSLIDGVSAHSIGWRA
ncbi:hypothetical protein SAM23877_7292 [Streptomyces ambofaciens ATCC 23877]|uniref:Uncharacterized protein n=1 Tax=Streptomyces ambofaciens (strain ATCC 23877 / 3486 / DSM 40053 / JCM 4204 / NBRC 12836 / NRRL B-2516) TaxID=278992 RepID=A0A0K2B4K8_STRA7|nr:hypothetical protein SAM23877_7292 [Streptomyces ambofaciens ATCC 23877]